MATSFSGGRSRSTLREPPTIRTLGIVDKHDIMGMILLNELGSYLTTTSLSSIRCGFAPGFVNYKKGCTRPLCHVEILLLIHRKQMIYLAIPSKCSPSKRYVQLFGLSFTGLNIKFMLPINLNFN
jgi:hypothetical protein